jgi:guanylate kinase
LLAPVRGDVLNTNSPHFGQTAFPLVIVISGPSGVGKDSVVRALKERDLGLHFVVTVNTRSPRAEEKDGVDYVFISKAKFDEMNANGDLLEDAHVYNDYKGVPRAQVKAAMESGKDVLMRLDVQGAATIRKAAPEAVLVFLTTSSEQELLARLKSRKTESEEALALRVDTAMKEFGRVEEFDYVVVNHEDRLEQAVDDIVAIIRAEHQKVLHRRVTL